MGGDELAVKEALDRVIFWRSEVVAAVDFAGIEGPSAEITAKISAAESVEQHQQK